MLEGIVRSLDKVPSDIEHRIKALIEENVHLRQSALSFGALAERLHHALSEERRRVRELERRMAGE